MTIATDVLIGAATAATASDVVVGAAIAIACMMVAVWAISLVMRDASIVDIAWGSGFVLVAWVSYWLSDGNSTRSLLLTVLTTIWGRDWRFIWRSATSATVKTFVINQCAANTVTALQSSVCIRFSAYKVY